MPNAVIEYGPPSRPGVTAIMGLGEDEYMEPTETRVANATRNIGRFSAALWLGGMFIDNDKVKNIGLGGLLVAIAISQASNIPGSHPIMTLLTPRQ